MRLRGGREAAIDRLRALSSQPDAICVRDVLTGGKERANGKNKVFALYNIGSALAAGTRRSSRRASKKRPGGRGEGGADEKAPDVCNVIA